MSGATPLLEVRELTVTLAGSPPVDLISGIDLQLAPGEARGIVGESGSGKSVLLRSILGLLPRGITVTQGEIRFRGEPVYGPDGRYRTALRGSSISMVFQEPATALSPSMRVGRQITDGAALAQGLSRRAARDLAIELMHRVGIPNPEKRVYSYPFELSGGMRQRVMIAAAIASKPALILCDEPTTALDVSIQARVLQLFTELRADIGAGLLWVTHDLAVAAEVCDSLTVLRDGRMVESSNDITTTLRAPREPYTQALILATPRIDGPRRLPTDPAEMLHGLTAGGLEGVSRNG